MPGALSNKKAARDRGGCMMLATMSIIYAGYRLPKCPSSTKSEQNLHFTTANDLLMFHQLLFGGFPRIYSGVLGLCTIHISPHNRRFWRISADG
jgi:hypothetical protein